MIYKYEILNTKITFTQTYTTIGSNQDCFSTYVPTDRDRRTIGFNEETTLLIMATDEETYGKLDAEAQLQKKNMARGVYEVAYYARKYEAKIFYTITQVRRITNEEEA